MGELLRLIQSLGPAKVDNLFSAKVDNNSISVKSDVRVENPINKFPLNWKLTSANPNVNIDTIISHPNRPWSWEYFSANPNLTLEIIKAYQDKPWDWSRISRNHSLTVDIVFAFPLANWDWYDIFSHSNFGKDDILKLIEASNEIMNTCDYLIAWNGISANPNLTPEVITSIERTMSKHCSHLWHWRCSEICEKSKHIVKIIESPLTSCYFQWNWFDSISGNPHLMPGELDRLIEKYPHESWCWNKISDNQNLTIDFISRHITRKWNWQKISSHRNITMEMIEERLEKEKINKEKINKEKTGAKNNLGKEKYNVGKEKYNVGKEKCNVGKEKVNINGIQTIKPTKRINDGKNEIQIVSSKKKIKEVEDKIEIAKLAKGVENKNEKEIKIVDGKNGIHIVDVVKEIKNEVDVHLWKWDWRGISRNPNLTRSFLERHIDQSWEWCYLAANPGIDMEMINWLLKINPSLHDDIWFWYYLSSNPNLTVEMIMNNLEKDFNWDDISANKFITDKNSTAFRKYKIELRAKIIGVLSVSDLADVIMSFLN